jgi:competence protein ComEC
MTLITLGLTWLAGILLAGWLEPPLSVLGLLGLPVFAALLLYRRERGPRLVALCALALLAGAARLLWATPHFGPGDLAYYNDQGRVRLVGVVADEPDVRDIYQNLRLRVESLTTDRVGVGVGAGPTPDAGTGARPAPTIQAGAGPVPRVDERPIKGMVLVQAPRYPARAYGDRLAVVGELETPPIYEGFSYRDYLARQGIYSIISRPNIELIAAGQGSHFWTALYAFKARAEETIAQILPEPYAALLTGILLGVEAGIPRWWYSPQNTIPACA